MPVDVVSARSLMFTYETRDVLRNISFSIEAGDYVGLVGQTAPARAPSYG